MITGGELSSSDAVVALFPDWLVEKYGLRDERLSLQTGEEIRYEDVKVPVSSSFRRDGLDYLLRSVEDQLSKGHEGLKWLKPDHLYQWLCFLFYGVLYYEYYSALKNRSTNSFLFESEYINRYRILLFGLNAISRPLIYKGFEPCTIVAFKTHEQKAKENFDLKFGLNTLSISLRMGDLGLMSALLDNATQKRFFGDYFDRYAFQELHPIQFDEMYAKLSYKCYTLNPVHEYGLAFGESQNGQIEIGMRIPEEQRETPIFMEWKEEIYLQVLSNYLKKYGFGPGDLKGPNASAITFLENRQGETLKMDPIGKILNA